MAQQFRLSNYTKILILLVLFIIFNSWYMLAGHSDDNNGNIDKINIIQTDKNEAVTSLRGISRDTGSLSTSITENIIATTKMPTINSHQDINLGLDTVLLIICANRPDYLKRTLSNVLKYHPRNSVPIVISEDGMNHVVGQVINNAKNEFQNIAPNISFVHMHHTPGGTSKDARNNHNAYYKLSSHFKWALNQVFKSSTHVVNRVILLEEDLEIAPDFFEYFAATSPLLDNDPTLLTVSAWNDNGFKPLVRDEQQLYRSDFFPGLGWMMTRKLWDELEPKWPEAYWDDWLREPKNRKNRHTIRPEICRTFHFGNIGTSNSEFGNFLNKFVQFTKLDLSYLDESRWNQLYIEESVRHAEVVTKDSFPHLHFEQGHNVRINYDQFEGTLTSFVKIAGWAGVMDNIKANVPRTAYKGVVSFWKDGVKMHITPLSLV